MLDIFVPLFIKCISIKRFLLIYSAYLNSSWLSLLSSWLLPAPASVFMSLIGLISQGVSQMLVGKEGTGQFVDVVVGADGSEVFDVVPEVRGRVGPVGNRWRFIVRH